VVYAIEFELLNQKRRTTIALPPFAEIERQHLAGSGVARTLEQWVQTFKF